MTDAANDGGIQLPSLRSIAGAYRGEFELLAERLRSDAELANYERSFLAELICNRDYLFVVKRRDARRERRPFVNRRRAMAQFVHSQVSAGTTLAEAVAAADETFRPNRSPRPATIRTAYREFFPAEYKQLVGRRQDDLSAK